MTHLKLHNASSTPQTLTGGGVVPVGESVQVKALDEHSSSLVDAGLLIVVDEAKEVEEPQTPRGRPAGEGREGK